MAKHRSPRTWNASAMVRSRACLWVMVWLVAIATSRPFFLAAAFAPSLPRVHGFHGRTAASKTVSSRGRRHSSVALAASSSEENEDPSLASTTTGVPSSPLDRPVLSLIDAGALLVFAGIGKASHAPDGSLDALAVATTALPFWLAWFGVAPLLGSCRPEATKDVPSAASATAKAWIVAVPLGCALRGISKGYLPPLPFVLVTMVSTLIPLSMGRVGYTVLSELYVELF